ncbi:MAG: KTSC domain-containing protein [Clostridiales bacterium]|nr:KTSC domain-containing protein [Candidatus Cacconaster stercorequi]
MKRLTSIIFLLCFITIFCSVIASAHPGQTDENGGHFDHSTSEYHYHHGYSAHQHYDIDGDGIPDCPYDFNDRIRWNSGSPSTSSGNTRTSPFYDPPAPEKDFSTSPGFVAVVFFASCFFALIICLVLMSIQRRYMGKQNLKAGIPVLKQNFLDLQSQYYSFIRGFLSSELKRSCLDLESQYSALQHSFFTSDLLSPEEVSGVPSDSYLDDEGLPRQLGAFYFKDDRYYVYVNPNSGVYHTPECRYTQCSSLKNYYILYCGKYGYPKPRPCNFCLPHAPDVSWVDKYKEIMDGLEIIYPGITKRHQDNIKQEYHDRVTNSGSRKVAFIYAKAANGMTVRIPSDKLEDWKKAQDALRVKRERFLDDSPVDFYLSGLRFPIYRVDSTCISRAGYNEKSLSLLLQMSGSGYWYKYSGVSPAIFSRMRSSDSVGRYYNDFIKGHYPSSRIPNCST